MEQKELKGKEVEERRQNSSFWIIKKNGKVYVEIVRNSTKKQLMPIIQGKILEGSISTDGMESI